MITASVTASPVASIGGSVRRRLLHARRARLFARRTRAARPPRTPDGTAGDDATRSEPISPRRGTTLGR